MFMCTHFGWAGMYAESMYRGDSSVARLARLAGALAPVPAYRAPAAMRRVDSLQVTVSLFIIFWPRHSLLDGALSGWPLRRLHCCMPNLPHRRARSA